ncbi:MAG: TonB C-terminal domain-containing protein [Desulfobulbaceae bacterium]|nr:TonB C-terminal domain-containing protein [Desulfobulbaceae bacterium]
MSILSLIPPKGNGPPLFYAKGDDDNHWKAPLGLAVAVHITTLVLALLSPSLFHRSRMPEVYTVNLFNVTEPAPAPPAPAKPPAEKSVVQKPATPQKAVQPAAPRKVISLKPLKTKRIKKKIVQEKKFDDSLLNRALNRVEAKVEVKKAREDAADLVSNAVDKLRESLVTEQRLSAVTSAASTSSIQATGTGGDTSAELSAVQKQYYASIVIHIQAFWNLPALQSWDDSLEGIVVLKLRRDGFVKKSFFEAKSKNIYFNRFVEKTIAEASPLPPFPEGIRDLEMEVGFRFRPKGIF